MKTELEVWEKKILLDVKTSNDGQYANLDNLHTAGQVERIFNLAKEAGIPKEQLVNPKFLDSLFDGDSQSIHTLKYIDLNKDFFFNNHAVNKVKEYYQINK